MVLFSLALLVLLLGLGQLGVSLLNAVRSLRRPLHRIVWCVLPGQASSWPTILV